MAAYLGDKYFPHDNLPQVPDQVSSWKKRLQTQLSFMDFMARKEISEVWSALVLRSPFHTYNDDIWQIYQ